MYMFFFLKNGGQADNYIQAKIKSSHVNNIVSNMFRKLGIL